jgi:hypothetical protein
MSQTKAQLLDGKASSIQFSAGSASSPTISFTGDTNTGIYSPGADQVAISTNGTGRLFVDSSGDSLFQGQVFGRRVAGAGRLFVERVEGSYTSPTAVGAANVGALIGRGYDGTQFRETGNITFVSDGTITSSSSPGSVVLATTPSSSTAPIERLRITSTGNVGIGTTAPGAPLDVRGGARVYAEAAAGIGIEIVGRASDNAGIIRFLNNAFSAELGKIAHNGADFAFNNTSNNAITFATNNSEKARIDSSGRLLVGTSSAIGIGGTDAPNLQIAGAGGGGQVSVSRWQANTAPSSLFAGKSRGATVGTHTVVQAEDGLLRIVAAGSDGSAFVNAAFIECIVDGTPGSNDMPGRLVFSTTADGTSSPTERMRLTAAGRMQLTGAYDNNIVAVAALDIDCSAGNYFTKTINGNSTFTVSNVPSSRAFAFTLELTHTSGTITWFSGVEWPGGVAPTLTTGKTHLFMFVTDDGGTRWRASSLINYTN